MMEKVSGLAIVLLSFTLAACGGSGGGGSSANNSQVDSPLPPSLLTGQFVDSPVQGLNYSTASQSGMTNAEGEFSYQDNEMVTFSIGGIIFPEVAAQDMITPMTVFSTEDIEAIEVVNMLRLLQSLDVDGLPDNGIEISQVTHDLAANMALDFSDENFADQVNGLILDSNVANTYLISADQALYHFRLTLGLIDSAAPVQCGNDHPMVGATGTFSTIAHDVMGDAIVLDNCTIEIRNFSYDGGGPDVFFYGAIDHDYAGASAFKMGEQLNGRVYLNESITVTLPNNKTLDDLNSISVWCVDFNADFGNLILSN